MASVINTNIAATRTHNVYNRNNEFMNAAMTRVATGMKINSAKDGASTWAISEKMRERIRANDQANQNVQNDTAMLKVAQGGIGNTIDILKTLKERALNGLNDSNINSDRSNIATEVYQLVSQIDDNAAKVKFNGRVLLNGDSDKTVGKLDVDEATDSTDSTDTTDETEAVSDVTEPAEPTKLSTTNSGSSAVYSLALFKESSTAGTGEAATSATKLTDLFNKSGAGATSLGISAGDKITISWKEDDVEQSKEITVTDTSTVADLEFTKGALQVSFTGGTASALSDQEGNAVKNSSDAPVNGTTNALNAVGDKGVAITDFKVSVTYADEDNDNALTTRTEAQKALAFTNNQALAVTPEGSNAVFVVKGAIDKANTAITDTKKLGDLAGVNNAPLFNSAATMTFTFKSGENTVAEVTMDATKTYKDLADELAKKGINLVIQGNGSATPLKDADGNTVTNADGDNVLTTASSASTNSNLYFVGKAGTAIDSFTISAKDSGGTAITADTTTNGQISPVGTLIQNAKAADSDTDTGKETATAASTNVTFHIGGEDGFNMNVSIKAMNMNTLFGTDEKKFAKMFLSTDDLKKGDGTNSVVAMIDKAISTALNEQTKLGAIESRLGYTSDNLTTMNENLEAADSVMRDSDIAKEMTSYMKYAVLSQASQYMLAQAGQNAFQVLNLLQQ